LAKASATSSRECAATIVSWTIAGIATMIEDPVMMIEGIATMIAGIEMSRSEEKNPAQLKLVSGASPRAPFLVLPFISC